jgi:hypothetical protein
MFQKQKEASRHIEGLFAMRGLNISSGKLTLPDDQQWIVFEYGQKQIGIDSASGLWVRTSSDEDWRCLAMPCTVSGAALAVEILTSD